MVEKIHVIIPLVAAIIVEMIGIYRQDNITDVFGRVILTIIIFFVLGCVTKRILKIILDYNLYDGLEIHDTFIEEEKEEEKMETVTAK